MTPSHGPSNGPRTAWLLGEPMIAAVQYPISAKNTTTRNRRISTAKAGACHLPVRGVTTGSPMLVASPRRRTAPGPKGDLGSEDLVEDGLCLVLVGLLGKCELRHEDL